MISVFKKLLRYIESFSTQTLFAAFFFLLLALSVLFNIFTVVSFPRPSPCQVRRQSSTGDLKYLSDKLERLRTLEGVVSFLSQPVVNELNFTLLINRQQCSMNTRLLIVVPSHPYNADRRTALRQRVLRFSQAYGVVTALVFFLGTPIVDNALDVEMLATVEEEGKHYNDIVQYDFEDVLTNLRLKAMGMLRWACTRCIVADHVIRIDDDVEIDFGNVLNKLRTTREDFANYILGLKVSNEAPSRVEAGENSTRYISIKEYPAAVFPSYLLGTYQAAPMRSILLLYQATLRVTPIRLEDVFITGICARMVDIALVNDDGSGYVHLSS